MKNANHRFDAPSGLAKQVKTKTPPSHVKTDAKAAKVTPLKKVAAPTSTHSKPMKSTAKSGAVPKKGLFASLTKAC